MKPLAADWKERLRREPERMLGLAPEASPSDDWAEYGRGTHPGGRIRGRVVGRAWEERPGQPVPGQGRSSLPRHRRPLRATTARRPLGVFAAAMRGGKNKSESVRWLKHRRCARLPRHAGRHRARPGGRHRMRAHRTQSRRQRARPGGRRNCCPERSRRALALVVRACRSKQRRTLCGKGRKKAWRSGRC